MARLGVARLGPARQGADGQQPQHATRLRRAKAWREPGGAWRGWAGHGKGTMSNDKPTTSQDGRVGPGRAGHGAAWRGWARQGRDAHNQGVRHDERFPTAKRSRR